MPISVPNPDSTMKIHATTVTKVERCFTADMVTPRPLKMGE
jgi:hypothetical protein